MAEELRITVVDGGGSAGGGSGGARRGGVTPTAVSSSGSSVQGAIGGGAIGGSATVGALASVTGAGLAIAAAFGAAIVAVKGFTSVVQSQVEMLAGFSGEVAVAQAETQLRRQMARFRRGQRIGSELASAENIRSRFETALFDVNTEILGIVLRIFRLMEPVLEPLLAGLEVLIELPDRLASELKGMAKLLRLNGMGFVADILKGMADILGRDDDDKLGIDLDPFLGLFDNTGTQPFKVRAEPRGGMLNTNVEVGESGGV